MGGGSMSRVVGTRGKDSEDVASDECFRQS